MTTHRLVLLRHGQSQWNLENRFTGWVDVDLSPDGEVEARSAARILAESRFSFDVAFTSVLKRAIRTLWIVLDELDLMWIPTCASWRLNERHYGALQGLYKAETVARYGEQQVHQWRRSYTVRPPPLALHDVANLAQDRRYRSVPPGRLPRGESLADTVARLLPYWRHCIVPQIRTGKRVLIAAHGNSLRALVKRLDGLSDDQVMDLEIPTGRPLVYELDDQLKPLRHEYLPAAQ